jgi:hypothetical protein
MFDHSEIKGVDFFRMRLLMTFDIFAILRNNYGSISSAIANPKGEAMTKFFMIRQISNTILLKII